MGRRITKMGRRREESAEKMLCCVQSKNEMGDEDGKTVCGCICIVLRCHDCAVLTCWLIAIWDESARTCAYVFVKAWVCRHCVHRVIRGACTCMKFCVITYEKAACWHWKPPDCLRQSRCSCQSVSPSHWRTATASASSRFWSSGCCQSLPAWVAVVQEQKRRKEGRKESRKEKENESVTEKER